MTETPENVTRFEVIDENGRFSASRYPVHVELSYQDKGRTLKVFLKPRTSLPSGDDWHAELARDIGALRAAVLGDKE